MNNCLDSLKKSFNEWDIPITSKWCQEVLKQHKSVNSQVDVFEFAFQRWLKEDISLTITSQQINLVVKDGIESFNAKHIFQINSIVRIDLSLHSHYLELTEEGKSIHFFAEHDGTFCNTKDGNETNDVLAKRVLKIEMTDGVNTYYGIEKELIPDLNELLVPGTKILLNGLILCSSKTFVLLKDNIQVLGSSGVSSWEAKSNVIKKLEERLNIPQDKCYEAKCEIKKVVAENMKQIHKPNVLGPKKSNVSATPVLPNRNAVEINDFIQTTRRPTNNVNGGKIMTIPSFQIYSKVINRINTSQKSSMISTPQKSFMFSTPQKSFIFSTPQKSSLFPTPHQLSMFSTPQKSLFNVSISTKRTPLNNHCLPIPNSSFDGNLHMFQEDFVTPPNAKNPIVSLERNGNHLTTKRIALSEIKPTSNNVSNYKAPSSFNTPKIQFGDQLKEGINSVSQFKNFYARTMSNDVDREADIVMASNYRSNVLKKPMVTFAKENTVYPPAGIFNTFRSNEDRKTEEDKLFWNNVLEMPDSPVLQSQAVSNKSLTSQVGTKRIKQSPSIEYIGTFNGPPVRKIQSTQQVFSQAATLKTETIDEAMRSVQQAFFYHETCIKGKVSQIVTNISIIEKKWVMKVELSDFIGKTLVCEIDPNLLVKYIGMTTEEAKKLKKEGNQKAKEDANQRMNKLKKDLVNKQLLFTLEIYADSGQCPMIKNIKKISEPDFYI